ncbi:enoyl-CoA hydratase/isomerase family protein [Billgrantia lactosivorans]|uniref:enoyl-CoA hydratase/isomerase family protein n=1 Tax=Billgrantia lactosivorans TaxID=2185141 RepID=UPI000DAEB041|nr:enoyl-CoA hydratase/isomerase family protein [Halomonas lactosivorans]
MDLIHYGVQDGVAEIRLDRPDKLNAITPAMASELSRLARCANDDDNVKAVLLTSAGPRAFCAGTDLQSLAGYANAWAFRNRCEYAAAIRDIRKPVVAALKGWVLGGGAELALAADIRVADETARFGFPEVSHGWVGGGGASQLLPRLCGYGQAMNLLLTGKTIDCYEAYRVGLCEHVVHAGEAESTARGLCIEMSKHRSIALQSVKASVRAALCTDLASGLRYENEMNTLCFAMCEHVEGLERFRSRSSDEGHQ